MKKFIRIFIAVFVLFALVVFPACSDPGQGESKSYTVTFNLNYDGADEPYMVVEVTEDEDGFTLVEEPAEPERENYTFGGWYTDADCTSAVNFERNIEADVTYYAKWSLSVAVVTFDPNYDGGESFTVSVNVGEQVSQPQSPEREGYAFDAWYTDADCTDAFDFSTAINDNLTLYAGWDEITSEGTVTITYLYNYDGAPDDGVYDSVVLVYGKKTTAPSITREGYYFDGWYTDADCENAFDFNERLTEDYTLYAKWLGIYTFEAEMTDLSNFYGYGYSGSITGWNAVFLDKYNTNASNGYFVTGMYSDGLSLTFCVYSEEEVDDAYLVLRLSAEFYSFTFTDDEFLTTVNGEKVPFGTFSFDISGVSGSDKLAFANFMSTSRIHLNKGENTIVLMTNNDTHISGTVYAMAPMVDCIYIYSSATVTWDTEKGFPLDTYLTQHTG